MKRIGLLIALALVLSACKTELYSKLAERDANEMASILIRHGIDVERQTAKDGSNTLFVQKDRFADAIAILRSQGLPRQSYATMADIFKGEGLIPSPTEERARFLHALSEGLSRTISDIDGVVSARVHVVLPKNDPLKREAQPSSASVFIRHDQNHAVGSLIPQIKMLVANSVEGLTYDKVSVITVAVDRAVAPVVAAQAAPAPRAPSLALALGAGLLVAAIGLAFFYMRRQLARRLPVHTIDASLASRQAGQEP